VSSKLDLRHKALSHVRDPALRAALETYDADDATFLLATVIAEMTAVEVGMMHADLQARISVGIAQQDAADLQRLVGAEVERRMVQALRLHARDAIDAALESNLTTWAEGVSSKLISIDRRLASSAAAPASAPAPAPVAAPATAALDATAVADRVIAALGRDQWLYVCAGGVVLGFVAGFGAGFALAG